MRVRRRRNRRRILAPDGSGLTPPNKPQPDGVLVKALARAWRWQKLLDSSVYGWVNEIAEAERISKNYVNQILRLALLAPDLIEAILGGWVDQGECWRSRCRPNGPSRGASLILPDEHRLAHSLSSREIDG